MKRLLDSVYSNVPDGGSSNGKANQEEKGGCFRESAQIISKGHGNYFCAVMQQLGTNSINQHTQILEDFSDSCPRCRYLVHRQAWRDHIASIQLPGQKQLVWLNEKPARFCGSWGGWLRCLCSHASSFAEHRSRGASSSSAA